MRVTRPAMSAGNQYRGSAPAPLAPRRLRRSGLRSAERASGLIDLPHRRLRIAARIGPSEHECQHRRERG